MAESYSKQPASEVSGIVTLCPIASENASRIAGVAFVQKYILPVTTGNMIRHRCGAPYLAVHTFHLDLASPGGRQGMLRKSIYASRQTWFIGS